MGSYRICDRGILALVYKTVARYGLGICYTCTIPYSSWTTQTMVWSWPILRLISPDCQSTAPSRPLRQVLPRPWLTDWRMAVIVSRGNKDNVTIMTRRLQLLLSLDGPKWSPVQMVWNGHLVCHSVVQMVCKGNGLLCRVLYMYFISKQSGRCSCWLARWIVCEGGGGGIGLTEVSEK